MTTIYLLIPVAHFLDHFSSSVYYFVNNSQPFYEEPSSLKIERIVIHVLAWLLARIKFRRVSSNERSCLRLFSRIHGTGLQHRNPSAAPTMTLLQL